MSLILNWALPYQLLYECITRRHTVIVMQNICKFQPKIQSTVALKPINRDHQLNLSQSCLPLLPIYEPPRGKTNNVVSEQVRHKSGCTSTEAG